MRVLIAGGSGLIGSRLTAMLAANGDSVTILSRNPGRVIGMPSGVRVMQWDGRTIQPWAKEIENTDAVINLTGENISGEGLFPTRWTKERKARLLSSRLNSGQVLTKAIQQASHKPFVFIQASGMGYYGSKRNKVLTEMDGAGDDFLASLSVQWEASSAHVETMGVRRVIVRNGIVLSTKGGALLPILLPYRLFVGGRIGTGRQIYSWIHIDDEVAAIQFLIQNDGAQGAFNLTAPNPLTNDEFGKTIARVMKRPHYLPLPSFAMQLAFGEVASVVLEGERVLPARLLQLGFDFRFPTLDLALIDLLKTT